MRRETFAVRSKGAVAVHLVPYSEHSSFAELQQYVRFLRPHQASVRSGLVVTCIGWWLGHAHHEAVATGRGCHVASGAVSTF
jgi:hypothetical protein